MEMQQIQYFIQIAELENISKAAEKLHISQPSLSSSLQRLETDPRYSVFDRNGKRISLNEHGKRFLENARQILNLVADSKLPGQSTHCSGRLSIAFQNHNDYVYNQILAYKAEHPEIQIDIYQSTLSEAFSLLSYDFIISNSTLTFPVPMHYRLLEERSWYIVVPKSSPLAKRRLLSFSDLAGQPFCFLRDSFGHMEDGYQLCLSNHFLPNITFTTNSPYYKLFFLSQGSAYGFIPTGWKKTYEAYPQLAVIPLEGYQNYVSIIISWARGRRLSETAEQFLGFLQEHTHCLASAPHS